MHKSAFYNELLRAKEMHQEGASAAEIRTFLRDNTKLKKTQICDWTKRIIEGTDGLKGTPADKPETIQYAKPYAYNSATEQYVFFTDRLIGHKYPLKKDKVDSILKSYSNFDGRPDTINEISTRYEIPKNVIKFIILALGMTHDRDPLSDESLLEKSEEENVDDLVTSTRATVVKEFEKRNWSRIQENSDKWEAFEMGRLNPYKQFVQDFTYTHPKFKLPKNAKIDKTRCHMMGGSDLHLGAYARAEDLFHGKEWNLEIAQNAYKKYVEDFFKRVSLEKWLPDTLYILCFGDIVHSVAGKTAKGTELKHTYPLSSLQVEAGFYCYDYQIQLALKMGYKKIVFVLVKGNHDPEGDWAIAFTLKQAYRKDSRVEFIIPETRWAHFKFGDSLFIMEHGSSAYYKSKVPKAGTKREAYIQNLILSVKPHIRDTKYHYFLTADQHTMEYSELQGFEFIRFSTLMAGDHYSDNLNLANRPRQNVLEVDNEGVRAVYNFYLQ